MKDEWIEQPSFETNKFEVGDRVRVFHSYPDEGYGQALPYDLKIEGTENQWVDCNNGKHYHFKQCRILKKREAEEFEYCTVHHRGKNAFWDCSTLPLRNGLRKKCNWIKVREVLDD